MGREEKKECMSERKEGRKEGGREEGGTELPESNLFLSQTFPHSL